MNSTQNPTPTALPGASPDASHTTAAHNPAHAAESGAASGAASHAASEAAAAKTTHPPAAAAPIPDSASAGKKRIRVENSSGPSAAHNPASGANSPGMGGLPEDGNVRRNREKSTTRANNFKKLAGETLDPALRAELLAKASREESRAKQRPNPKIALAPKALEHAVEGWVSSIGSESQQNLPREIYLTEFIEQIGKINAYNKRDADLIRKINFFLQRRIEDILKKIEKRYTETEEIKITPDEEAEISDLLTVISDNKQIIKQDIVNVSQLFHAVLNGNLAALESAFGSSSGFGSSSSSEPKQKKQKVVNPSSEQQPRQQGQQQQQQQQQQQHQQPHQQQQGNELQNAAGNNPEAAGAVGHTSGAASGNTPAASSSPSPSASSASSSSPSAAAAKGPGFGAKIKAGVSKIGTGMRNFFGRFSRSKSGGGQAGGGGEEDNDNNKTRKNRHYIHEIKENRTQLFNKEMEIINSIRNFKHGPNENGKNKPENIQKKFIKVIKRS